MPLRPSLVCKYFDRYFFWPQVFDLRLFLDLPVKERTKLNIEAFHLQIYSSHKAYSPFTTENQTEKNKNNKEL
jgi:hypothetical protein